MKTILKVFGDEDVQIDPVLKETIPDFVVSTQSNDLRMDNPSIPPLEKDGTIKLSPLTKGDTINFPHLEKGGEGRFESRLSPWMEGVLNGTAACHNVMCNAFGSK